VTRQLQDWRNEIEAIDAELVRLVNRRARLAVELLSLFRRDLSLGDLNSDADRLSVLLFQTGQHLDSTLDQAAVAEFFRVLSRECRRLAEEEIMLAERNGNAQSKGSPS